jgi:uncharacterized protein YegL
VSTPLERGFDERVSLVLVLDTSESMGKPYHAPRIAELNAALREWVDGAKADPALRDRLEIAMVTFDSDVHVLGLPEAGGPGPFRMVGQVVAPDLRADGRTLMLSAIDAALSLALERSRELNAAGIPSRRPHVWLLTDGAPSDPVGRRVSSAELEATQQRLRAAEMATDDSPGCLFYAIGVAGADLATLRVLAPESTMALPDFTFLEILKLVSETTVTMHTSRIPAEAYRQAQDKLEFMRDWTTLENGES